MKDKTIWMILSIIVLTVFILLVIWYDTIVRKSCINRWWVWVTWYAWSICVSSDGRIIP